MLFGPKYAKKFGDELTDRPTGASHAAPRRGEWLL
jgi:hypothetical protein